MEQLKANDGEDLKGGDQAWELGEGQRLDRLGPKGLVQNNRCLFFTLSVRKETQWSLELQQTFGERITTRADGTLAAP